MTADTTLVGVPAMDLARMHASIRAELLAVFDEALNSSAFIGGQPVEHFEEDLARYVGTTHAVAVASGTAALHLALVAAGIGPGDEVILPTNTFFATCEAVICAGAEPVLVDVVESTALIDRDAAAAAIGARTAAIVPVHLYGQPVPMEPMRDLAARHNLLLLEDAAQAIGARWHDQPVGSLGSAAAFSFYPGKNLGALGDAGAITTDDAGLAGRARILRSHGERRKYVHETAGWCERMDALQAALLRVKLRHLPADQQQRDTTAGAYRSRLDDHPVVRLLEVNPFARHVHHQMVVRVPHRDRVQSRLLRAGIGSLIHYPIPVHRQPAVRDRFAGQRFPVADALARSILSLPLFAGLSEQERETVCDVLDDVTVDLHELGLSDQGPAGPDW